MRRDRAASVLRSGAGSDTFMINEAMVTALQTPFGQPGNNGPCNASVDGGEGDINTVNPGGARQLDTLHLPGTGIVPDLTQIRNIGQMDPEINGRISGIEIINLVDQGRGARAVWHSGGVNGVKAGAWQVDVCVIPTRSA